MADGQGNGNGLADAIAPFQIVIQYHPVTHQITCQLPQCDEIIRLGMLEFAKVVMDNQREQQKPIVAPNFMLNRGPRGPRLT